MYNTAIKTIEKYNLIQKNDIIIAGVSGGADSSALLYFLYSLRHIYCLRLFAVHVNHGIRGEESYNDMKFVENLCKQLCVKLSIFEHNIKQEAKELSISEEEAGREARYKRFYEVNEKYGGNKIAVAHNMNDNCETLIMRLCRGTGLKGLSCIPPKRGVIIRPLIECTRESIEKYCVQNNIDYCIDSTNMTDLYTRNKIRLKIMPVLEEINTKSLFNIAKAISHISEDENFLERSAEEAFYIALIKNNTNGIYLSIDKLLKFDNVIIKRVLRFALKIIKKGIKDLSSIHINSILEILYENGAKELDLPHGLKAEKSCGILKLYLKENQTEFKDFCYELPIGEKIYIKEIRKFVFLSINEEKNEILDENVYTKLFDYDRIKGNITIRNRQSGDRISLKGLSGHKKLKDFFIERKIPKSEREQIALFACDSNIIWAVGLTEGYEFGICERSVNILNITIWEEI